MRSQILFFILAVVLPLGVPQASIAESSGACAVTRAPDPPFVAPPQWGPDRSHPGEFFFFGTPGLWALVHRRLDAPAPLVWAARVNGAGPSHRADEPVDLTQPGFMVTRLEIPTAGCWEITARYTAVRGQLETVSYTAPIEP